MLDPDRLFAPLDLTRRDTVIVAVSGGSDSTALLLLFKAFAARQMPALRIVAVTVDHGLRSESAAEAHRVRQLCRAIGIYHRIVEWQGAKPEIGVAAAARLARYRLLDQAAREAATDLVLLGHTSDDQAETVAMRQARGVVDHGRRGDAGMAPAVLYDDRTWFVRPLLGVGREMLREFLRLENVTWIEDPSNSNRLYERVRVRQGRPDRIVDTCPRLEENFRAAELLSSQAGHPAPGLFQIELDAVHQSGGLAALRMLLAVVGGTEYLPDVTRAEALVARVAEPGMRATLSRVAVTRRRETLWLHREARGLPPPRPAGPDDFSIWDGRFRISARLGQTTVAPIGAAAEKAAIPVPSGASRALVRQAFRTEPGLWKGEDFVSAAWPDHATRVLSPWRLLLPSFDLAPAAALACLLGSPKPPRSPWR